MSYCSAFFIYLFSLPEITLQMGEAKLSSDDLFFFLSAEG